MVAVVIIFETIFGSGFRLLCGNTASLDLPLCEWFVHPVVEIQSSAADHFYMGFQLCLESGFVHVFVGVGDPSVGVNIVKLEDAAVEM